MAGGGGEFYEACQQTTLQMLANDGSSQMSPIKEPKALICTTVHKTVESPLKLIAT